MNDKETEFIEWFMDNYSDECIEGEHYLESAKKLIIQLRNQCKLYRETIIQMLSDEEKKISNRIKYFNEPLEISRDELLAKYKYQLDDIVKRKKRFKEDVK